jgi:hypothetical protein
MYEHPRIVSFLLGSALLLATQSATCIKWVRLIGCVLSIFGKAGVNWLFTEVFDEEDKNKFARVTLYVLGGMLIFAAVVAPYVQ